MSEHKTIHQRLNQGIRFQLDGLPPYYVHHSGQIIAHEAHLKLFNKQFEGHRKGLLWAAQQMLSGNIVFHGASFILNNHWYIVLGQSGQGKSSLLAALSQLSSVQVLGDDVVAYQPNKQQWLWPSSKAIEIRLWEQAAKAIEWPNFEQALRVHPEHDKRRLPMPPVALNQEKFGGFVLLNYGKPHFFSLPDEQVLPQWMGHLRCSDWFDGQDELFHFQTLSHYVGKWPVYVFQREENIQRLQQQAQALKTKLDEIGD